MPKMSRAHFECCNLVRQRFLPIVSGRVDAAFFNWPERLLVVNSSFSFVDSSLIIEMRRLVAFDLNTTLFQASSDCIEKQNN